MRTLLAGLVALTACTEADSALDGAADINGDEEKADGAQGIEVSGRLRPGTVDAALSTGTPRPGYVIYVGEGSKLALEVTRTGSTAGLDTMMKVYGPRLSDGSYPKTIASDDDSGYAKLSKISGLEVAIPGFYLVEVTSNAPVAAASARLQLSCTGSCDSELPVAPLGNDLKWYQRSAERRALSLMAYRNATRQIEAKVAAGVPAQWAVVLDIDETSLDNSPYQKERADLGLGKSPATWRAWVDRKAAAPIAGALAFTQRVKALGGKVVFVSNRSTNECVPTQANLATAGFQFDGLLCRTGSSDKNPRFEAIEAGTAPGLPALAIQMFVGDNIQDFPELAQDIRTQPDSAFAKFGDTFIVIPNPMYGSWEKNVD